MPEAEFSTLDAGVSHVCGLTVEGELLCWGQGEDVTEAPTGIFRDVDVLGYGGCALDEAGYASCWPAYVRDFVPSDLPFDSFSDGKSGACTLTDRRVDCYCNWDDCQIRYPPSGQFASIATGMDHACALDRDGVPTCWGGGAGYTAVPPEGVRFATLSAGDEHTCGITLDGDIRCWAWFGYDYGDREGTGDEATWLMADLPEDGFAYRALSLGGGTGIALDEDGQIHTFGAEIGGSFAEAMAEVP